MVSVEEFSLQIDDTEDPNHTIIDPEKLIYSV